MALIQLPKQHGAWSILAAAFVLGSWFGGGPNFASLVLLIAVISAFIGWETYSGVIRSANTAHVINKNMLRSAHLLIALSILLGLWLVIAKGLKDMLLIGASALWLGWIGLELERRRKSHTIIGEFAGIAAMSLIAPAAEYCASSLLSGRTFGIYLMCTAFFGGSVFHVRFVVRQHKTR